MRMKCGVAFVLWAAAACGEGWAAKLETPRFFVNWEVGQIEEAHPVDPNNIRVDKEILHHANVWTLQEARLTENSRLFVGIGGAYYFVFPRAPIATDPNVNSKRSAFGLTDAHGEFNLLGGSLEEDHLLLLKAGIILYKYSPDAKNLGEYMFRSWTYPTIVYTGGLEVVNNNMTQLSGLIANTKQGIFSNDVMLTLQTEHAPIFGLSLTDIATVNLGILSLGAGIMFDNFYHPDDKVLESHLAGNRWYTLASGKEMAYKEYKDMQSAGLLQGNDTLVVDSGYYSFSGQKAMVRATLDLGKLMPESMVSEGDMRLYFESILLGIKNYPTYYEDPIKRTVTLVGFNFPTFRLLDLLSVEAEYAPTPWKMSTDRPHGGALAAPIDDNSTLPAGTFPTINQYKRDDWKWTVLAKKSLYEGLAVYFQAANDHMRLLDNFSSQSQYEIFQTPKHWYWAFSLKYSI